ncbi:MAG: DUF1592 domain-containing protein [Polyangiaceae bacterium]
MSTRATVLWVALGMLASACGREEPSAGRTSPAPADGSAAGLDGAGPGGDGGPGDSGGPGLGNGGPVDGSDGGGGEGGTAGVGNPGPEGGSAPISAGLRPLRLMTQREYQNTIRDLVGVSVQLPALPADEQDLASGFAFHTTGVVTQPAATQYAGAAQAVATAAVANLNTLLPCYGGAGASAAAESACLASFLGPTGFASQIYRRPLTTTATTGEVDRLTALYQTARMSSGAAISDAMELVIETMLQTPGFLYHWELDPGAAIVEGALVKLGNYEIANRLSYLLWGTMPDATLFAAAAAGQLGDMGAVESQVRRMLTDPKAADTYADFFIDWLDLDIPPAPKDPTVYPQYTDALAGAMTDEVRSFVDAIVFSGTGRFDDVLTGTSSFANQDLANLYGISGVTGAALAPVSLNPAQRSGLFTTGAFLSATGGPAGSDPPLRGNAIYEKLLCELLPGTAPATPMVGPPAFGTTTRQQFAASGAMPCATSCHAQIDPLGFAFENYDGIGAYRTTDNGAPVDARVTVTLDGQATTVDDARGLLTVMTTSDEVQTCFARQWLRYGLGRLDTPQDATSLDAAASAFKSSMRDIRELVVAIATSPTFRYRTPGTGETLQ